MEINVPGIVYLVGAGPGDPELLTVKALRLIRNCDALVHDALIPTEITKEAGNNTEIFHVGKRAGKCSFPQAETNSLILKLAKEGKNVVRLKGGDPLVFSRGGEEVSFLEKNGVSVEIVPGITSGIAASTYFGIPLTHRDAASSVTFVTGHEQIDKEKKNVNWRELAKSSDSLVIYMGIRNIEFIVRELILGGLDKNTKCAVIQEATLKNQKCMIAELKNLVDIIKDHKFSSPSIVVIGKIVDFKVNNNITKLSQVYLSEINQVQLYNNSQK
tara:strand:- start:6 stop:821 length:816 start_codon:yes stop_codon:yes gene_type:complete